ncbi:MAG: hypothetical protein ABSA02_39295 [Trebonia sp.]
MTKRAAAPGGDDRLQEIRRGWAADYDPRTERPRLVQQRIGLCRFDDDDRVRTGRCFGQPLEQGHRKGAEASEDGYFTLESGLQPVKHAYLDDATRTQACSSGIGTVRFLSAERAHQFSHGRYVIRCKRILDSTHSLRQGFLPSFEKVFFLNLTAALLSPI